MDFSQYDIMPKMIVFDLDYTLWPFWIEMYDHPFIYHKSTKHYKDKAGRITNPYPEVTGILKQLKQHGFILGVASRTSEVRGAHKLIETLGWNEYFDFKEIYPGCKVNHFDALSKNSKISVKDMLFFDDEHRNIHDLKQKGVVSILVENGVTSQTIQSGFTEFVKHRTV